MGRSLAHWLGVGPSTFLQIGISQTIQQPTMAESDQQIVDKVQAALDTAVGILNDKEGWKVEKEKDGATIKSKKNAEGRKVWICEVVTPVPASKLWEKLQDTDNIASWNTTLTESRVLRHIGDVKLSYCNVDLPWSESSLPPAPSSGSVLLPVAISINIISTFAS